MATGAPTPNADNLTEEELEKLTAPNQGDTIASAVAPATSEAAPETPNAPAAEEAAASDQASAPSAADLDTHAADAVAAAATSGTVEPPTQPQAVDTAANTPTPVTPQIPVVPEPVAPPTPPPAVEPEPPAVEPPVETPPPVTPPAQPAAAIDPGHQFTGKIVNVHVHIKEFDVFDHVFNISSEPLVDIINRVAKAKFGVDLNVLPGLRLHVQGEEKPVTTQAHLAGVEDDATIELTYD